DTRAPQLNLDLPRSTVALSPVMTLTVGGEAVTGDGYVHVDIDYNRDGKFTSPGERNFMLVPATPGTLEMTMRDLPGGHSPGQARLTDAAGNQAVSRHWINVAMRETDDPSHRGFDPEAAASLPSGNGAVGGFNDGGDGGGGKAADQFANEQEPND